MHCNDQVKFKTHCVFASRNSDPSLHFVQIKSAYSLCMHVLTTTLESLWFAILDRPTGRILLWTTIITPRKYRYVRIVCIGHCAVYCEICNSIVRARFRARYMFLPVSSQSNAIRVSYALGKKKRLSFRTPDLDTRHFGHSNAIQIRQ
jgi:hypothetical protein